MILKDILELDKINFKLLNAIFSMECINKIKRK